MSIQIYTKLNCNWCERAKSLLTVRRLDYDVLLLDVDYTREELKALVGNKEPLTVPQIVIDGVLIGGYDDIERYFENS